jgi:hypothetical protein
MSEEEAFEDIRDDVIGKGNVWLKNVRNETVVLLLAASYVENQTIKHTIRLN